MEVSSENTEICGLETNSATKKSQRKRNTTYLERIVLSKDDLPNQSSPIGYLDADGLFVEMIAEERKIKMQPTKKEKAAARRISRKAYLNDPLNAEKIKKNKENEETKKKRKAYSQKTETKDRKKLLAKQKRQVNRYLKEKDPEYYAKLIQKIQEGDESPNQSTSQSE